MRRDFLAARGEGTHEYRNVFGQIDIITGTLGKALGGRVELALPAPAPGICYTAKAKIAAVSFQARFAPMIRGGSLAVLDILGQLPSSEIDWKAIPTFPRRHSGSQLRHKPANIHRPCHDIQGGEGPASVRRACGAYGVYVVSLPIPVVPGKTQARIQTDQCAT